VRCIPLGVDEFGQVGSHAALRDAYGISTEAIVAGSLAALEPPADNTAGQPNGSR
jgi:pyruvate dehydrogenase complex dehydrogenase (E1) component